MSKYERLLNKKSVVIDGVKHISVSDFWDISRKETRVRLPKIPLRLFGCPSTFFSKEIDTKLRCIHYRIKGIDRNLLSTWENTFMSIDDALRIESGSR